MRISDWSSDVCSSDLIEAGESLDDLLPEAFATVREAAKRVLGQRHYDVQMIGGMVLHRGEIAEMRTGEGKTLVATLATYLNALPGKGVHVVTVNDYLASRDAEWMGQVYRSEEQTSELQSLMRISYAVFCLKKKKNNMSSRNISPPHESNV